MTNYEEVIQNLGEALDELTVRPWSPAGRKQLVEAAGKAKEALGKASRAERSEVVPGQLRLAAG